VGGRRPPRAFGASLGGFGAKKTTHTPIVAPKSGYYTHSRAKIGVLPPIVAPKSAKKPGVPPPHSRTRLSTLKFSDLRDGIESKTSPGLLRALKQRVR